MVREIASDVSHALVDVARPRHVGLFLPLGASSLSLGWRAEMLAPKLDYLPSDISKKTRL